VRCILCFVFLLCLHLKATCQAGAGEITIKGKVVDISSGKAIKANISYKSLPTGGIKGKFNDSTYAFSIFGSSRYEIMAELPNYIPAVAIVDPGME
jgi:OOP family OmpA-OmpF porin